MPEQTVPRRPEPRSVIVGTLHQFGYRVASVNEAGTDFRFEIFTESNQRWRAQLTLAPPSLVVQFLAHCSTPYLPAQRARVAELTQRVDEKIACLGGFGFHWPSGSPFYRYGVDYEGQLLSVAAISRQMNAAAWPIKVYKSAFEALDMPKMTPEKAVDISLLLHECAEEATNPREALKVLLRVEDGGDNPTRPSRRGPDLFAL